MIQQGKEEGSVTSVNPPSREGMLMGRLVSLELAGEDGTIEIKPKGVYLGWLPGQKTLCILTRKVGKGPKDIAVRMNNLHRKFHNCDPSKMTVWEWPDPVGRLTPLGRLQALTYKIPPWLKSPEKDRYLWHHEFGDHGERGHGPVGESGNYPIKYMPLLQIDTRGHLFIKRMPGNKFYVTDWLYW